MAVIEIGAATLPGFPYTFPYRTGVRAYALPVGDAAYHFFVEVSTDIVASAEVFGERDAKVSSTSVGVVVAISADSLVTRFGEATAAVIGSITAEVVQDYIVTTSLEVTTALTSRAVCHRQLLSTSIITASQSSRLILDAFSSSQNLDVTATFAAAMTLQAVGSATVGVVAAGFAPTVTMHALVGTDVAVIASLPSRVSWGQFIAATTALTAGRAGFLRGNSFATSSTSIFADTEPEISTPGSVLHASANALLNVSAHIVADSKVERYAVAEVEVSAVAATAVSRVTYGAANSLSIIADGTGEGLRIQYVEAPVTEAAVTIDNVVYKLDGLCKANLPVLFGKSAAQKAFLVGNANLNVTDSSFPTFDADFVILADLPVEAIPNGVGNFVVYANSELEVAVTAQSAMQRGVYIETLLEVVAALQNEIHYAYFADANLDVLVENLPAIMLYRHSGGNPMWLTFFYAGNGRQ